MLTNFQPARNEYFSLGITKFLDKNQRGTRLDICPIPKMQDALGLFLSCQMAEKLGVFRLIKITAATCIV